MRNELLSLKATFYKRIEQIEGCSDGNCIIRKPSGAHTNGGCRCPYDAFKMRRVVTAANEFMDGLNKLINPLL